MAGEKRSEYISLTGLGGRSWEEGERVGAPLCEELLDELEELDLDDLDEAEEPIRRALNLAFLAGARFGVIEQTAQLIEEGVDVRVYTGGQPSG